MDNVQKHNTCNNIPSSQTFRSYLYKDTFFFWKKHTEKMAEEGSSLNNVPNKRLKQLLYKELRYFAVLS
jgi:hypothetical protein